MTEPRRSTPTTGPDWDDEYRITPREHITINLVQAAALIREASACLGNLDPDEVDSMFDQLDVIDLARRQFRDEALRLAVGR